MALTNLSQITTSGIATGTDLNIRNITGVAATFTGNVTVGGTLTYDDVTNIDSVGLITARSGISVTGGAATFAGDVSIADKIVHTGDTNTSIRFLGPDTITAETAGSERLRITNSGLVGIGTNNPTSALEIRTTTTNAATNYRNNASDAISTGVYFGVRGTDLGAASAGDAYIYSYNSGINLLADGSGHIDFATGGTASKVRITSGGTLDFKSADGVGINFRESGYINIDSDNDDSNRNFSFYDAKGTGSENRLMILTDTGKVGVGSDNPGQTLSIAGSSAGLGIYNIGNHHGNVYFFKDGTPKGWLKYRGDNDTLLIGNVTDSIHVLSSGNVGINETTPEAKLEVDGRIRVLDNNDAVPSTGKGLEISYFNTADYADILSYDRGGNAYKDLYLRANNLVFRTGPTERLRITSAGDLSLRTTTQNAYVGLTAYSTAINTTLGSTAGTSPRLYLKGVGNGQSDAGDVFIAAGTGGIVHIRSAELMKFEVNSDSSLIEGLRIDSNGRIGINQTSPDAPLSFNTSVGQKIELYNAGTGNEFGIGVENSELRISSGAGSVITFRTGGYSGTEKLRIDSSGTILTNAATIDNTSSHGVIVAHAPASNADTGYKSIEIGNSNGSGSNRGSTICGQPKSNSHPPYTLIGCWDTGTNTDVYYGGGWGSNMRPATQHRFYTNSSYPTSNGSGTERIRITGGGFVNIGGNLEQTSYTAQVTRIGGNTDVMQIKGNVGNAFIRFTDNDASSDYTLGSDDGSGAGAGTFILYDRNNSVYRVVVNSSGNIGVRNTNPSSKVHIGDLIGSASNDANTTHTSLIIKQTNNDNKSGFYIERSGERKGYYMWMNPGGGAGDGLTFTRNNNGTKSDALILDRDANLTAGGHIYPSSNNTYDLGSTSNAWRNVYTNDLHLSNMSGGGNDVDGTTGDWTIQEGEENLYIINNRSGKKYKFNLQEVN